MYQNQQGEIVEGECEHSIILGGKDDHHYCPKCGTEFRIEPLNTGWIDMEPM